VADAPWQCPQCGTINEPVANSCRSCGRWPSLFDLERGAVPDSGAADRDETWSRRPAERTVEVEQFEPETYVEHGVDAEPVDFEPVPSATPPEIADEEEQQQQTGRGRLLRSLIVPIAFAIYILISIVFGDRGAE
jgi:hypothetical protein